METHTDTPTTFAQRLTRGFFTLMALLVLYVLSLGPAEGFFPSKFGTVTWTPSGSFAQISHSPLYNFYSPVAWAAKATGLSPLLARYCDWWRYFAARFSGKS